jgi:hypothetical protein
MAFLAMPNILLTEEKCQLEGESMNLNDISSVNVKGWYFNKERNCNITKSYLDNKEMIPEPPTLPAAPTFKSKALKENLLRKIIKVGKLVLKLLNQKIISKELK